MRENLVTFLSGKKTYLLPLLVAITIACGGCVAPARSYSAPDFTKVDAAAKHLSEAHGKIAATTARAETKLAAGQKNADTLAEHSATIINLVDELTRLAPPELQPRFAGLKTAVQADQAEAGELVTNLAGAQKEVGQLKSKDIPEAVAAKAESDAAIATVKTESKKTAADATNESLRRYKAESQLISQKIWKWAWRIGGGSIVLVVILLFVAGKISIAGIRAYLHI